MNLSVAAIIPARYDSTRFPGKPLLSLHGKPLIQWVYERAKLLTFLDYLIVATDDVRIARAVENFGGRVVMTRPDCESGTVRVAEAVRNIPAQIVINIQGDEPLFPIESVAEGVRVLQNLPEYDVVTLGFPLTSPKLWQNPSLVKVVINKKNEALYFSRSPIPFFRDANFRPIENLLGHIGIYIFRKKFLNTYTSWSSTELEKAEQLEQLRILEHGVPIYVVKAAHESKGVDTPEDVEIIEKMLKEDGER